MNILELDEAQGLTVEMLHSWLLSHGWRLAACEQGCGKELVSPSNRRCNVRRSLEDFPWSWALIETRMSAQALLREINPRMRKGWPSESACAVADRWIAQNTRTKVIIVGSIHYPTGGMELVASLTVRLPQQQSGEWSFWPCDASGNKVRWPTDAKGNML